MVNRPTSQALEILYNADAISAYPEWRNWKDGDVDGPSGYSLVAVLDTGKVRSAVNVSDPAALIRSIHGHDSGYYKGMKVHAVPLQELAQHADKRLLQTQYPGGGWQRKG